MSEAVILFVVEGEKRDYRFVDEMVECFLKGRYKVSVINVPASQNIYMLYEKMVEDDFDTDVVEVLRESVPEARAKLEGVSRRTISEVYLFFDFDPHQDNLSGSGSISYDAVAKMLEVFDNETENGKLFISYPMVEALYDYRLDSCQAFARCFVPVDEVGAYKGEAGTNNPNASLRMGHAQWSGAIEAFVLRTRCLFDVADLGFETYRKLVTPETLFAAERELCESRGALFVLSAFPEFLLDYFRVDFWNSHVKRRRYSFDSCAKGR